MPSNVKMLNFCTQKPSINDNGTRLFLGTIGCRYNMFCLLIAYAIV